MFLKSLVISKKSSIVREIIFRKGINLVVDESKENITGNNVGKTTVLKLVDYCFGAKKKIIWEDPENKKEIYRLVKDHLIDNDVLITLTLSNDLDSDNADEVIIERNFKSSGKSVIRRINGEQYTEDEYEPKLKEILFPNLEADKPSLRQIVSHNIRYKDLSLNNTLRTLDAYTSDAEYETLYLFLLGIDFTDGNAKQKILQSINQEIKFQKRLERYQTKSAYSAALAILEDEIEDLNERKNRLNINEDFEKDLNRLNQIKYNINKTSSQLSKLKIRQELIIEAKEELESNNSQIDLSQLRRIYDQATESLGELQKSFENMVEYHNQMISEKISYISKELPEIEQEIIKIESGLNSLLKEESEYSRKIAKSDSFEELESLIDELNDKYRLKGEYENTIYQLEEVEENLKEYYKELDKIEKELFSDEFEENLKSQLKKFNKHFSQVSEYLYNEKYALKYDVKENKNGQKLYKFSAFNLNFSSGKKQGEITCFDIAYILFAREENIPCMDFLLTDKKELMHNNQLEKITDFVNQNNIQFVASILKDKLPTKLNKEEYFILELSESEKLFKIEG